MHFSFDDDQLEFQRLFRDFLVDECPASEVRAAWDNEAGWSLERWRRLAELGVLGMTADADSGGLGLTEVDLVLLLEEAGRAALPEPFAETAAVAVPLLREGGLTDWLDRVASGDAIVVVGLSHTSVVPDVPSADLLLLQAGETLFAVEPAEVEAVRQESVDGSRRLFAVRWSREAATPLLTGDAARSALAAAFDRGTLATAAELVGVGDRLTELAADYARQRVQFGRPIGAFQAVKHLLADSLLRVAYARPVVYRAAASMAHDAQTRTRDVSMAKVMATRAARQAAKAALQIHGAIGYTWEHDLHLWLMRAHALERAWGTLQLHQERVEQAVLEPLPTCWE